MYISLIRKGSMAFVNVYQAIQRSMEFVCQTAKVLEMIIPLPAALEHILMFIKKDVCLVLKDVLAVIVVTLVNNACHNSIIMLQLNVVLSIVVMVKGSSFNVTMEITTIEMAVVWIAK